MPEGEEDKAPWAAEETSIDWSPLVITNLEVQLFKSEVRQSRLLTVATMQFSGIDDAICKIVSVVGIDWNIQIHMMYERRIWIHIIGEKYEFIWYRWIWIHIIDEGYEFISSRGRMNSYHGQH